MLWSTVDATASGRASRPQQPLFFGPVAGGLAAAAASEGGGDGAAGRQAAELEAGKVVGGVPLVAEVRGPGCRAARPTRSPATTRTALGVTPCYSLCWCVAVAARWGLARCFTCRRCGSTR